MIETLLLPFTYGYMFNAMWVSALVGGVCAFLSAYLMLKGWSLIGDALSHSIVPGVAGAYMLGLPFALGAFAAGGGGRWCNAVSQPALGAQGRHYHRPDLHLLLRVGLVHGVAIAHVRLGTNHYHGQYPCHHAL